MSAERSIAEIIGYHLDWPDGSAPYKVWWKDGRQQPVVWKPQVDDLLSWLRAEERNGYRFGDCSAWRGDNTKPHDMPNVWLVKDDRYDVHCHGVTMLAAFEAAVRVVSGG